MDESQAIQRLLSSIENLVGLKPQTPKDFDAISQQILQKTRKRVSSSTLKRLWGYRSDITVPRQSTLDILAQFIGYDNYLSFCEKNNEMAEVASVDEDSADSPEAELPPEKAPLRKPLFSSPLFWLLSALLLLVLAGVAFTGWKNRQEAEPGHSSYVIKKGQTFATYQDYLTLFGIHAKDTLWGQRLPHHPAISVWGPRFHHHEWHNDGDSAQLLPTIAEWWEPDDGSADSVLVAIRNQDHYVFCRDLNELRITFMQGLTPDGDSLTFCGVYRMDRERSNPRQVFWMRVADDIDLSRLDYLEELRN